jgi:hypothetical protein
MMAVDGRTFYFTSSATIRQRLEVLKGYRYKRDKEKEGGSG